MHVLIAEIGPGALCNMNSMKNMEMYYIVNSTIIWVYNLFYKTFCIVPQNSIGNALICFLHNYNKYN